MFRRIVPVVVTMTVVLPPAIAFSQPATGTLTGIVRDGSGGAVPGAAIKVLRESATEPLEAFSDERGAYQVADLVPGAYRIDVSLDGFDTFTRRVVIDAGQASTLDATLLPARLTEAVVVTARRIEETVQEVPIPVSVVSGELAAKAGAFNVNRLKEMIPTVQFYSTNPRNSAINIRGLGAPFGLTNDGIEAGVGLYIDGVFYSRPAAASLDFIDVERIEVLRGPQGTLFGKNTTAGALNVTTRKPTFAPESEFELNYGNYDYVQAKGSISGPFSSKVAGRLSFSGTRRDGLILNTDTQTRQNSLNNLGVRGTVLFAPSDRIAVTTAFDATRQRPEGYSQVVAGVAPTLRSANRQYPAIAADLGYTPPSFNAFDRVTDIDTALRANQDLGGASVNVDWKVWRGRFTSTTGWRYWNWDPSSDRDFIGVPVTTVSAAPSTQRQWTQEVRYAGEISRRANLVVGGFVFQQGIDSDPAFTQEQGSAAARFFLAPSAAAATPGLLDGYGFSQYVKYRNVSAATFGQLEWAISDRLRVLPGLRFNYDTKSVDFDQQVYGGLQTSDPALVALQRSVLAPQSYAADVDDTNVSGQLTVAYRFTPTVNSYTTYATGFKSVGLNLNGVPTDAQDRPVLSAATVKPEDVHHFEAGLKTEPFRGVTANVTVFNTDIENYQAQVVNASVGVLRGYLANAEKVRVRGAEFDTTARLNRHVYFYGSGAYNDGRYLSFPDAPPPLEDTGGPQVKDISGSALPGISKWAASAGAEYSNPATVLSRSGELFGALDVSYRSSFSSSASASRYLIVDGYSLLNARVGIRWSDGWTISFWARNLLGKNYFELLSAAPGNTGLYVGQPGDQRTIGVTLRVSVRPRP
jgi:iron complex outermembrane receptor protein